MNTHTHTFSPYFDAKSFLTDDHLMQTVSGRAHIQFQSASPGELCVCFVASFSKLSRLR